MSTTAEQPINPEVAAEIEAMHARLAVLEGTFRPKKMDVGDWKDLLARQQTQKLLEVQARARAGAEARESVLDATRKERESLEARLQKVNVDRSSRLAQHQRAEAKIRAEFAEQERAATAALGELRDRVDAEVKSAEAAPVTVIVPPRGPRGIDHSSVTAASDEPMKMSDGRVVRPMSRQVVGRWK